MFSANTKEAVNATIGDAKNTAYNAKHDFQNAGENVGEGIENAANEAGRKVRGMIETANEQISDTTEKVSSEIRSNPVRSTAIALGIGFVLGVIFRR